MKYLPWLPIIHFDDDYESLDLKEEYYDITTQEHLIQFVIDKLQFLHDLQNLKKLIANSKRLDQRILRLEGIALPLYGFIMGKTWESIIKTEI